MALSTNPTKTRGIEKSWIRDINRRWRRFSKEVMREFRSMAAGNIVVNVFEADPA